MKAWVFVVGLIVAIGSTIALILFALVSQSGESSDSELDQQLSLMEENLDEVQYIIWNLPSLERLDPSDQEIISRVQESVEETSNALQLVKDIAEGTKQMTNAFVPLIGLIGGISAMLLNWSKNKRDNKKLEIELLRVQAELSAMRGSSTG